MKKTIENTHKMRKLVVFSALPLALVSTAASCSQSDKNTSETNPKTITSVTSDWFSAPFEPRNNPSKIPLLSEEASIDFILNEISLASTYIYNAVVSSLSEPQNHKLGATVREFFAKITNNHHQTITDLGTETLTNFPKIISPILAEIINTVWQVNYTEERANFSSANLVTEMSRLIDGGIGNYQKIFAIFNNYANPAIETTDLTKSVGYSWANLLQFVRIAIDPTPDGLYPFEGFIAMLRPIGKSAIDAFNENIAKKWEVKDGQIIGGYGVKKLDLTPRKLAR